MHSVSNTREHGCSSGEHNVSVQILSDINVALHDAVVGGLVNTSRLHTQERGLEECLWATETLVTDGDNLSVWQLIALLKGGRGGSGLHLLLEVEGYVGELLLDVTDDFTLSGGGEGITTLSQDLHEVVSQVASSQIETEDGVGKGISFIDGYGVGDTITRVQHDTSGASGGIKGQHGLDGNVHGGGVEGLEHDLGHLLSVGLGVQRGLSQQDGVLLRGNTEL